MKVLDEKITPQNRLVLCRAMRDESASGTTAVAHRKLTRAYNRAHHNASSARHLPNQTVASVVASSFQQQGALHLTTGFAAGFLLAMTLLRR
jgi:hypothetical protein